MTDPRLLLAWWTEQHAATIRRRQYLEAQLAALIRDQDRMADRIAAIKLAIESDDEMHKAERSRDHV